MSESEKPESSGPAAVAGAAEVNDDGGADGEGDSGGTEDLQEKFREMCRQTCECAPLIQKLEDCNSRVHSKISTTEKCVEEVIDLFHCVDHCAAKKFFHKLK